MDSKGAADSAELLILESSGSRTVLILAGQGVIPSHDANRQGAPLMMLSPILRLTWPSKVPVAAVVSLMEESQQPAVSQLLGTHLR